MQRTGLSAAVFITMGIIFLNIPMVETLGMTFPLPFIAQATLVR